MMTINDICLSSSDISGEVRNEIRVYQQLLENVSTLKACCMEGLQGLLCKENDCLPNKTSINVRRGNKELNIETAVC